MRIAPFLLCGSQKKQFSTLQKNTKPNKHRSQAPKSKQILGERLLVDGIAEPQESKAPAWRLRLFG
jgi:hypothetical protein